MTNKVLESWILTNACITNQKYYVKSSTAVKNFVSRFLFLQNYQQDVSLDYAPLLPNSKKGKKICTFKMKYASSGQNASLLPHNDSRKDWIHNGDRFSTVASLRWLSILQHSSQLHACSCDSPGHHTSEGKTNGKTKTNNKNTSEKFRLRWQQCPYTVHHFILSS